MKLIKKFNLNQFFLTLFLNLWSIGQLQRIQLNHTIAFYLHDLVLAGWIAYYLIFKFKYLSEFIAQIARRYKYQLFVFFVLLILGWLNNVTDFNQLLIPALYLIRIISYLLFGLLTYLSIKDKSVNSDFLYFLIMVVTLTILTLGFSQYLLFPDMRFLAIFGWDDHYYRLIYPFFDPAFTGEVLVILILSWLTKPLSKRLFAIFFQILLVIAIAFTFSRASYLALALGLSLLLFFSSEKKIFIYQLALLILAFVTALVLALKPGGEGVKLTRVSTIEARIVNVNENIHLSGVKQQIIGQGLFVNNDINNQSMIIEHNRIPDNFLLMIYSQMGIIGILFFITIGLKSLNHVYYSNKLLFIVSLTILFHSLFSASFIQPFILLLWSFLSGWRLASKSSD